MSSALQRRANPVTKARPYAPLARLGHLRCKANHAIGVRSRPNRARNNFATKVLLTAFANGRGAQSPPAPAV